MFTSADRHRNARMRAADGERGRGRDPDGAEPMSGRGGYGFERLRFDAAEPAADARAGLDLTDLDRRSKDDLYQIARRLRIDGRCRMSREELIEAIRGRE